MSVCEFSDTAALGDARAWLREQVTARGGRCPCCSQFARVYRRRIAARMARDLVVMHRTAGDSWFRIPDVLGYPGGDAAKLRYWSLIDPETEESTDGNRRTRFRVTGRGREFIHAGRTVPKYALVFDGRLMGLDDSELVTITDCLLGGGFVLADLLGDEAGEVGSPFPAF